MPCVQLSPDSHSLEQHARGSPGAHEVHATDGGDVPQAAVGVGCTPKSS
jgi:hypothetical protein